MKSHSVKLFWFSKKYLKTPGPENFGDALSKDIVEKVSGKKVVWQNPKEQSIYDKLFSTTFFAIGSILHFATKNCTIWGSGLIDSASEAPDARYIAVRGPETRRILMARGFKVPEIYGDPGLLTSKYFDYKIIKECPLGIIPHYVEIEDFKVIAKKLKLSSEIRIIDMRSDVETVLKEILACEMILSSSLHGLIIPMSYRIPSCRMIFSDKITGDGIKYEDYFKSVEVTPYKPLLINENNLNVAFIISEIKKNKKSTLIQNNLENIQDGLLAVNPF